MADKTQQSEHAPPGDGVIYEFEDFRFEPGAARLEHGKDSLHLPPKELSLLEVLAKNHGRLVKHRVIWDTLWPDQDVSYESLTRCVYSLRRALGKNGGKLIKSVPRQGYTFSAPTKVIMPELKVDSVVEKSIQALPTAHSLYQLGLLNAGLPSYEHQQRAITFFQRASETDPGYSVPLGAIAETSMYQSVRGYLTPADAERQASAAYSSALAIDPDLVSALAAKAWFEGSYHGDTQGAIRLFNHAQSVDPNHALTYLLRGWVERASGQLHAAMATQSKGIEVDPLNLALVNSMALTLFYLGRTQEALEFEKSYLLDRPEIDVGHLYASVFYSWMGDHEDAIHAGKKSLEISPNDPNAMCALSYSLARAGFADKARKLADQSRATTRPRPSCIFLASSYLALGEEAIALAELQEARDRRCPWFAMAAFDPRLEPIRDTPALKTLFDSN